MAFRRVGIIGLGLIGGSIAKALKEKGYYVATIKSKSPDVAKARKILDRVFPNLAALVASLLHNPPILFLDEPTIGLDINAKLKIRGLLNKLSKEQGTTLFLTSHDTADIEQVCDRVLILDQGTILLDNSLKELKKNFIKRKRLTLTTDVERLVLDLPGIKVLENEDHHFVCEINVEENPIERVIHETLKRTSLKDVTIEDPSMEEIIRTLYKTRPHG
jgi:ABC-2 type transport system ATP-binding protein